MELMEIVVLTLYHSPFPYNSTTKALFFNLSLSALPATEATMNTASKGTADAGKQRMKVKREMEMEYEDDRDQVGSWDEDRKKKGAFPGTGSAKKSSAAGSGGSGAMRCCQAEKCSVDLSDAKQYHRRHKVCEHHAKAEVVLVGGIRQRFCQQCSRFHELPEFDEAKRSCRRRLAGHNERRRKSAADSHMEGSSSKGQLKDLVCGKVDERGRIQITIQENSSYKHFQIR